MREALYLEISRKADNLEISLSEGEQTLTHYEECRVSSLDLQRRCSELLHLLNAVSRQGKIPTKILHELQQMGQVLYNEVFPVGIKRELTNTSLEDIILKIDNRLVQVPWELMYTGKEFFCERFNIGRMVKTQQAISSGIKKDLHPPLNMLIITDPRGDLPAAYEEGNRIRESIKQRAVNITLISSEVSVDYLKKKMLQFDLIHYAGHADYDLDDPSASGWILEDGKFTALDIRKLSGVNPLPGLVFSNACQSGTTEEWQKGVSEEDKIYGLANAFLLAGVQHYIGTFWKVLDKPSTSFAIEFYRTLFAGQSIGQAMRSSRLALKEHYGQENILWASYLLYGDPTARYFESQEAEASDRDFCLDSQSMPYPGAGAEGALFSVGVSGASTSIPHSTASIPSQSQWNPATEWLIQEKSRGGLLWKTRTPSELMERSWKAEQEYQGNSEQMPPGKNKPGRSRLWGTVAIIGTLAATGVFFSLMNRQKATAPSPSNLLIGNFATVKATSPGRLLDTTGTDVTSLSEFFQGILKKYQKNEKKVETDTWTSRPLTIFFSAGKEGEEAQTAILINKIIPRLQLDPRITVLERDRLDIILQELALSSSSLANQDSSLRLGQLLSSNLFSVCSLYRVDSKLEVTMRIIESETSIVKVAVSEDWGSEVSSDAMADRLSKKITQTLDEHFPLRGRIKAVTNYDEVILNIGAKHGLKSGIKLKVYKDQQTYQNGEIISGKSIKVGEVEVSGITADYGYAKVLGRSEDLATGMRVVP
jgi:CHAT domain-containing protein